MAMRQDPLTLDLQRLSAETELSRPVAEAIGLAASVVLERLHGPGASDLAMVHGDGAERTAVIGRVLVDGPARATYADPQEATEEGGEGVGVATAHRVLERIVFRRLPKGTGADYLMRDPSTGDGDAYERLECSGIGDGRDPAEARLRSKLRQLARFPEHPPGYAIVTDFGAAPVEIRYGRWSR